MHYSHLLGLIQTRIAKVASPTNEAVVLNPFTIILAWHMKICFEQMLIRLLVESSSRGYYFALFGSVREKMMGSHVSRLCRLVGWAIAYLQRKPLHRRSPDTRLVS